jgi:hypothetical protein
MISVSFTNNMRDITSGIGTAVPSGAPEFTQFLVWVCVAQSLISVHCLSFHLVLLVALFIYSSVTYLSLKKNILYCPLLQHVKALCKKMYQSPIIGEIDFYRQIGHFPFDLCH